MIVQLEETKAYKRPKACHKKYFPFTRHKWQAYNDTWLDIKFQTKIWAKIQDRIRHKFFVKIFE